MKLGNFYVAWYFNQDTNQTIATVSDSEGYVIGRGVARKNPKDEIDLAKGRYVSLDHALLDAGIDREGRAAVWNDFKKEGVSKKGLLTITFEEDGEELQIIIENHPKDKTRVLTTLKGLEEYVQRHPGEEQGGLLSHFTLQFARAVGLPI